MLSADDLRDRAPAVLRSTCGRTIALDVGRWVDDVGPEEGRVLEEALGPALDIGCGPGRMVHALRRRGIRALGIDVHPAAIAATRARGGRAIRADVFGRVPAAGRWSSALLLDGNVGIGGDPPALLARVRELLRPRGRLLAEVEAPGTMAERLLVRAEVADEHRSDWFPWAIVGMDQVPALAAATGFRVHDLWHGAGRWFARLDAR